MKLRAYVRRNDYWKLDIAHDICQTGTIFEKRWLRKYRRLIKKMERIVLKDFPISYPQYKREYMQALAFQQAQARVFRKAD